jgi:putative membrane protein
VTIRPGGAPGLQAERTRLSWERAGLAAIVSGALLLFSQAHHWMVMGAAGTGLVLALALALIGIRRGRRIASDGHAITPARRAVLASGGCVALFGTAVFAVLSLAPPP